MSAYIVSKSDIDVLVAAGSRVVGDKCPTTQEHCSKLGQMLLDECVASVSYRYSDSDFDDLPGSYVEETICDGIAPLSVPEWITPYEFNGEGLELSRPLVEDTIGSYEYQSCEHPGWDESWARKFCQGLRTALPMFPEPVPEVEPQPDAEELAALYGSLNRDETIKRIRTALRRRSGKAWSVTGGRGTGWGWISISSPPKRRIDWGRMTEEDQRELAELLGLQRVHCQGESIPSGSDYYREYIDRAEGRTPSVHGVPYWD